ncbi:MAG: methyltransferase domain-containing protein [Bacteroidota bacterium]
MRKQLIEQVKNLVSNKKENSIGFCQIDALTAEISQEMKKGNLTQEDIAEINRCFGKDFMEHTIQGHGLKKPYGYAGDFLMIDKIYTFHKSKIQEYAIWDTYFHQHAAPKAVRNRKEYFKELMHHKIEKNKKIELLNVASGPARDLKELYEKLAIKSNLRTTCVEMDKNAIVYAKKINKLNLDYIEFIHKNIFSFQTNKQFDVIWSAGLFDYFDDKAFVTILRKFREWLKSSGEIVIGNFNESHNPSRDYMEIFGEWELNHRTEANLKELAKEAGFYEWQISVGKEHEQVNLFLHISMY